MFLARRNFRSSATPHPARVRYRTGSIATLAVVAMFAAACGSGDRSLDLTAEIASFDVVSGEPARVMVGLFGPGYTFVTGGRAEMQFALVSDRNGSGTEITTDAVPARYVPVIGTGDASSDGPKLTSPADGRGVYESTITFNRPGFWRADTRINVDGHGPQMVSTVFEVKSEHEVPSVGDRIPDVMIPSSLPSGRPAASIDSRAFNGGTVPDLELHEQSIRDALAENRPVVAVFSTPVYCVSRFCGPITDFVSGLAHRYGDRATFVHVEIYENFEQNKLNPGVNDWLDEFDGLHEPWVFLIGGDGVILKRWDDVIDAAALESDLIELPVFSPAGDSTRPSDK